MTKEIRNYKAYLEVLEMLLLLDARIADSYFYEYSFFVSDTDYLGFRRAYERLKSQSNQSSVPSLKDRIMELAILLKLNPKWAETRFKYRVYQIEKLSEHKAYCSIYRYLKEGLICFCIAPANKKEALSWQRIMLNVSKESSDLYYNEYTATFLSKEEYNTLNGRKLQNQPYEIALENPAIADQFYSDHAVNMVTEDTPIEHKRRAIHKRIQFLLNNELSEADAFYNSYGQGYLSLEEYHQIKRANLLVLIEKACEQSLEYANTIFENEAKGIVSQTEYDSIRKPFVLQQLRDLCGVNLKQADVFYRQEALSVISKAEYEEIQSKPRMLAKLKEMCEADIRDADRFFRDEAYKIVTPEEIAQIKRPFLLEQLETICKESIPEADALFIDCARNVVSLHEYSLIKRSCLMKKLRNDYAEDQLSTDRFYEAHAKEFISIEEYNGIRRPVVMEKLRNDYAKNQLSTDRFYETYAKGFISIEEYNGIRRSVVMERLRNDYAKNQLSTDRFYETYAKGFISVEEYNGIRRPVVTRIVQDKCECSFYDAQLYYQSYAKEILSVRDYNSIRKPFLFAELRRLFLEDYMGALDFYNAQLRQIISEDEFRAEAGRFVSSWFAAQQAEGKFKGFLPDSDQARAISAIQGNVLVTARAGSGKTATMINRAYYMMKHCHIPAEKILMLAFNKDAASQMQDRLKALLKGESDTETRSLPHIMTFHALAYRLVLPGDTILYDKKNGVQTQSRFLQEYIIRDYLKEYVNKPGIESKVRDLMMDYFRVNIDDHQYLPRDEFLKMKRSAPQESLKGDAVKSYGEKRIANFLFEHDVEYSYERSFRWNGRSYRPDFTIPTNKLFKKKGGLIIEYLGLQGDPEYDEQTEEKRTYWLSHPEWQLIEIVPEDIKKTDAEFEAWFKEILKKHRVNCRKLSEDEIWKRAREHAIDDFTKAMLGFIQRCRKLCISPDDLHARIQAFNSGTSEEMLFAKLAEEFYRSYLNRVKATKQDDFDGLMIRAIDKVKKGGTEFGRYDSSGDLTKIQYIAIDEYQDFSELFYRLITAIHQINPSVNLYCVGDDWQAINGFAGSDLRFFRDYDRYFGQTVHIDLLNNYRSQKAIVDAGNALMRGLGTPGRVAPSSTHESGKVYLCCAEDFSPTEREKEKYDFDYISPMVRRIIHKQQKCRHSVALLDRRSMLSKDISSGAEDFIERTRHLFALEQNMQSLFPGVELVSSTVHSFKGLEKDAVILLDVTDKCFPLIHPNWRFSRILGENIDEIIEAERRLFYVALTRAKCDLYLLTERGFESDFLKPISEHAQITQIDWREYQSDLNSNMLSIEVGNQPGRGISPTQDIRELLKQAGFHWIPVQKVWNKSVDQTTYDLNLLKQEDWYVKASGIVVNIYDSDRELVDGCTRDGSLDTSSPIGFHDLPF